jgi:type II secretory pathway pseudopilin PulG
MSLIEVIIALSLVSLVILFLFGLLPSTGLLTQQAEQQTFAASLADEIIAHLDSTGFNRLRDNPGTWNPGNPGPFSSYLTERTMKDGTRMTPEVTIESIPPTDHLVQAIVTVRWQTQRRSLEHRVVRRISSVNR